MQGPPVIHFCSSKIQTCLGSCYLLVMTDDFMTLTIILSIYHALINVIMSSIKLSFHSVKEITVTTKALVKVPTINIR